MTTCILIISVLTHEVVGCLPPDQVMTMQPPKDRWERLQEALEKVKK